MSQKSHTFQSTTKGLITFSAALLSIWHLPVFVVKQKWNGIAQHLAAVVLANTDIAILTLFSTLKNVSVYAIYSMISTGIFLVVSNLGSGIEPILGSIIAKKENKSLNHFFNLYEWLMHNATVLLFSATMVLITDFVKVYTKSVTDVNYYVPVFAILLTIAYMTICIHIPYNCVIQASGHFKETQISAIIEPIINLVVSVALVFHFGLVGVAIGTIVAITYRMFYLAIYLTKHIMQRPLVTFLKYLITDSLITYVIYYVNSNFTAMTEITYYAWAIRACKVFSLALVISAIFNFVFYNKLLKQGMNYIFKREI